MPQRGLTPARGGRNAIKCCIHGDPTILETSRRVERECIQPAAVAGRGVKGRGATGFALRVAACILSLSLTHTKHTCMHTYIHPHTPELIAHVLAATVRHSAGQTSLVGELASLRDSGHKEV